MADIFLSYASQDVAKAKLLAEALAQHGWEVFWDRSSLMAGQHFRKIIEQEIDACQCMIVAWSQHAIESNWVLGEAGLAYEQQKLAPILFTEVRPPIEYRVLHTENLAAWNGEQDNAEFKKLLRALISKIGPGKVSGPLNAEPKVKPTEESKDVGINPGNPERAESGSDTRKPR